MQGCTVVKGWESFMIKNEYGRTQLKPQYMILKGSFDKSRASVIDTNAIYYYNSEDKLIDMEFNFILRFFENGQYAFFGGSQKPVSPLSHEDINYNNLDRAGTVGYFDVNDSIITLEYPNQFFRRSGKRNLDKYKILPNGNIESITKAASDYGAVYQKILISNKSSLKIVPDW